MNGTREPMHVNCGECRHEWVAAYLPMSIDKLAPLMKAPCPMCGGKTVLMGQIPRETPEGDPIAWLAGGDTGTSSETIWHVMMGRPWTKRYGSPDYPHDPDDFGRCYRLLKVMPSWRGRLGEVAAAYPESAWPAYIEHWDELTALYEEELPSGWAPKTYNRMHELRGDPHRVPLERPAPRRQRRRRA